jgi:hypothetical protein
MPSVATYFARYAGILNMHDFLLFISSVFELLHQQVYLGRQHVYLLELMHTSTSLASLNMFFIPTLVGSSVLNLRLRHFSG